MGFTVNDCVLVESIISIFSSDLHIYQIQIICTIGYAYNELLVSYPLIISVRVCTRVCACVRACVCVCVCVCV